jgi:hypothetical protein
MSYIDDINNPNIQAVWDEENKRIQDALLQLSQARGFNEYIAILQESMDNIKKVAIEAKDIEDIRFLQAIHASMKKMLDMLPLIEQEPETQEEGEEDGI